MAGSEQFVQNAQSILEKAAQEWSDLRLKALSALEQADQDQLRFRNLALAREQQRFQEHIARWQRDLEDLRSKGEAIDGNVLIDRVQLVLDFAGFIPVLGAGPDLINTIISAGRGNWGEAAINAIAIIPFWGDGVKAGKMLVKAGQEGVQHVDEISAVVNAVAKNGDKAKGILKAGDEAGQAFGRNLDELDELAKNDAIVHMPNDGLSIETLGITAFSQFKYATRFGFKSFDELKSLTTGMGVHVHHLLEERFAKVLGEKPNKMLSIVLTKDEHQAFTNAWRKIFPYEGQTNHIPYEMLSPVQIRNAARSVYADFPEILRALGLN